MAMIAERLDRGELPEVPGDITVTTVQSAQDKDDFIQFVYSHYRGDPNWVPPLLMERRDFLNPKKNPWFEFGRVELLLARRHGKVVGRIAAVNDPRYNEFHNTKLGFFGMFECINHPGVARGLFDAAASRNRAQGFERMIGPVNFSTNYECSVLIEGFDAPPAMLMAYNPRYYPALYQACGFEKAKDLLAWDLSSSIAAPPRIVRVAEKIRVREGIVVRPINPVHLVGEVPQVDRPNHDSFALSNLLCDADDPRGSRDRGRQIPGQEVLGFFEAAGLVQSRVIARVVGHQHRGRRIEALNQDRTFIVGGKIHRADHPLKTLGAVPTGCRIEQPASDSRVVDAFKHPKKAQLGVVKFVVTRVIHRRDSPHHFAVPWRQQQLHPAELKPRVLLRVQKVAPLH